MRFRTLLMAALLTLPIMPPLCLSAPNAEADEGAVLVEVVTLLDRGGRVSWSNRRNLIAVDRIGGDGFYDVFSIRPDGTHLRRLTGVRDIVLPQLHNGQPAWHPSGKYIVFQSLDPELGGLRLIPYDLRWLVTAPGGGLNNNLWLMTSNGRRFWQLTHVKSRRGVLHPHFSHDGTQLLWSEIVKKKTGELGLWAIKIADFSFEAGEPRLSNIRTLRPNRLWFYETHGFSPDGGTILFSSVPVGGNFYDMEIYSLDLYTMALTRLTDNDEWDEHAHFSPDGRWIVWASSEGIPQRKKVSRLRLDYWIMSADGSGQRRLIHFNDTQYPEYIEGGAVAADSDWGPDGESIATYLIRWRADERRPDLTVLLKLDIGALQCGDR